MKDTVLHRSKPITQQVRRAQQGQAMVEFLLSLIIIISFFFFYVKLSAVFAIGNYIHYVTFMSARAYLSSAPSQENQRENAESVLSTLIVGKWRTLIKAKGGDSTVTGAHIGGGSFFQNDPTQGAWNQGTTFRFVTSVGLYPWNKVANPVQLDLTSESWLGREQSTQECETTKTKIQNHAKVKFIYWENGAANSGC